MGRIMDVRTISNVWKSRAATGTVYSNVWKKMLGAGSACLFFCLICFSATAEDRPNILLMLFDDMGFSDLGCFGGDTQTPNIDRLAEGGLRFSQFYNASKCEPSRASLLSGLSHKKAGIGYEEGIQNGVTLGEVLRTAGYHTMALGKWHVAGNPYDRGFDRTFGWIRGCPDYFRADLTGNAGFHKDGKPFKVPQGYYLTRLLADQALELLDDHYASEPEQPFFMYYAISAPHWPIMAPEETIEENVPTYEAGWDEIRRRRLEYLREQGLISRDWKLMPRPESIPEWTSMPPEEQAFEARRMAVHAAMIQEADKNFGRILDRLEQQGELDNTLILILSDNGATGMETRRRGVCGEPGSLWFIGVGWANTCNTPFKHYKVAQYHGGTRTAMIAHWPKGITDPGGIRDQRLHIIDVMPTFAELAAADYPAEFNGKPVPPLDGVSFASLFKTNPGDFYRPPLFFHMLNNKAVIADGWKLASDYNRPWALYDLEKDGTETTDLSRQYPERARALREMWEAHDRTFPMNDNRAWTEHQRVPLESEHLGSLLLSKRSGDIPVPGVLAEWRSADTSGGFRGTSRWEANGAVIKLDETRFRADYQPVDRLAFSHMNGKSFNPDRYIQLIVPSGKVLSELAVNIFSSKAGPQKAAVRSNVDGFVSNVVEVDLLRGTHNLLRADLSTCPQATELRIYLWDAQGLQKGWLSDNRGNPAVVLKGKEKNP
jgi:arylsulfatase A-like enzyme